MKKKTLALILCGLMTMPLASCSGKEAPPADETPVTEAETEAPTEDPEEAKRFDEKAQNIVRGYLKSIVEDGDAVSAVKYMYPSVIVMKTFTTEQKINEKLFDGEKLTGGIKLADFKVEKCEPLTDEQMKNAEAYYEKYADVISGLPRFDYTVLNGREISVTATLKDGSDSQDYSHTYVVVDLGDEGLKLITTEASELDGLAD